ncbi:MarR family transcriptional regulator [uncultured Lacinutrix sp.]|uniref:MarR family winged helix-turn-helix transcriptional regulator n=1 Tax=uncultured Lacinutrix sp. TaxID=574032 RepID=UPI00262300FF|nr:MarR family transcriptional regulator [uncultured Lacinutrix sp.]
MGDLAKEINSTFPDNDLKAYINILFTASWINSKQIIFFKPFNISPQQYNILRILKGAKKAISVQTVKNRMVQRSPNVTRLMDKLCAKSLIERTTCTHDRRVVNILITEKGLSLIREIDKNFEGKLLANLSEAEAKQLSDLLDKIR